MLTDLIVAVVVQGRSEMTVTRMALGTIAAGLLSSGAASAQEQTLQFKHVITTTSDATMDLPSITDQSLVASVLNLT